MQSLYGEWENSSCPIPLWHASRIFATFISVIQLPQQFVNTSFHKLINMQLQRIHNLSEYYKHTCKLRSYIPETIFSS